MTRASGRQAARGSAHRHAAGGRPTSHTVPGSDLRHRHRAPAAGAAALMGMPRRPHWHLACQLQEATMPSMPVPDSPVMDPIEVSVPSLLTENSSTAPAPPVST
jgi:hypothetical protein